MGKLDYRDAGLGVDLVMRELLPVTSYIEMWLLDGALTHATLTLPSRTARGWRTSARAR
ncbi:hypothetical protein [Trueperella bernardiae]|uniref:hypothetical protein n=1 Tax=Trueperella bernardiae TaxID=59561 RepID=UPI000AF04AA3|nr:hypothetical protein [Trueperella bernardiae]